MNVYHPDLVDQPVRSQTMFHVTLKAPIAATLLGNDFPT